MDLMQLHPIMPGGQAKGEFRISDWSITFDGVLENETHAPIFMKGQFGPPVPFPVIAMAAISLTRIKPNSEGSMTLQES
jgi:hypothetical protein